LRRLAAIVAAGGLVTVAMTVAAAERNNYYAYTDENGVLHVTNVPQKRAGAWKLWKSLEGSGGEEVASTPPSQRANADATSVQLGAERYHEFDAYIRGAADRYQLPESLIRAVIHTESNYRARSVSRAGAAGLMQLMPKTARALGVKDVFDPRQSIYGGSRYLRLLANRYGGDMVLVLAAYNAGAGNVEKHGGVPPFAETRAYVRSVLRRFYAYERQAQLGDGDRRRGPARHIAE
jgi:soluble lytic murein transglycosylase-like protein